MIVENGSNKINTNAIPITVAMKLYNKASAKNCPINCAFVEPVAFRIPTSFALLEAFAVERFMKFTQARRIMNIAILPKM